MPGLSVLLATYNRAEVLRETLEAMAGLEPPGANWELIVADNRSSDRTQAVCKAFAERLPLRQGYEPRRGAISGSGDQGTAGEPASEQWIR